jgi:hypothetical protein
MGARRAVPPRRPGRPPLPEDSFLDEYLDPIDRLAQTIYSVLIILTFTLAYRIFKLDPGEVATPEYARQLVIAILGATLASGLVEGVMYVLLQVFDRSRRHRMLYRLQAAETTEEALELISDEIDYFLEPISGEDQRQALYEDVLEHLLDNEPQFIGVKRDDLVSATVYVGVAFASVLPSLLPLVMLLAEDYVLAMRLSNVISTIVLFVAGYRWGRYTSGSPWKTGLLLVGVAAALVLVAIPLGG